jgi:hypothetical protein
MTTPEPPDGPVNPYQPPQADCQLPVETSPLRRRPAAGDVAFLLVLQVGMSTLAGVIGLLAIRRPMTHASVVGTLLGAIVFALLRCRRTRPWTLAFRLWLVLWGTLVWGMIGGGLFALTGFVFMSSLRLPAATIALGLLSHCLYYLTATLLGILLGSWRGRPRPPTQS